MKPSPKLWPRPALGRGLLVLGALYLSSGSAAQAQNIDEGKSAPQLYAATCAACHRNPGALAKGRFRATLAPFLQDHYTTGVGEAWALAGYLASVDAGPARPKAKPAKRPPASATQPN
jgi:mono/diheme cytochrome c family protein